MTLNQGGMPESPLDRISRNFRPTRNRYTCQKCGKHIITEDRDEGVTPFMIGCRVTLGCDGLMHSSFYRDVGNESPTFIWRKPSRKEYKRASRAMRDHFDQGGLDIYPCHSEGGV